MTDFDASIAFDAMVIFLEEYWIRGGKSSDDIAVLLGSLGKNHDGLPMDIALWDDWRRAYGNAKLAFDSSTGGEE